MSAPRKPSLRPSFGPARKRPRRSGPSGSPTDPSWTTGGRLGGHRARARFPMNPAPRRRDRSGHIRVAFCLRGASQTGVVGASPLQKRDATPGCDAGRFARAPAFRATGPGATRVRKRRHSGGEGGHPRKRDGTAVRILDDQEPAPRCVLNRPQHAKPESRPLPALRRGREPRSATLQHQVGSQPAKCLGHRGRDRCGARQSGRGDLQRPRSPRPRG
jgi:hypothetical protein